MSAAADDRERAAALDPTHSFIVEAPAGSGKTELLTRRFLKLLGAVELPEQIVAITFTRKAAAEMRQRVIETLKAAAEPGARVPAHREVSLELARGALERSRERGWSLPEQCQRLRILTIDALNTALARQLPILTSGIVSATVTDDAERLYRLAAERTTESLGDDGPLGRALRRLLGAADNSLARLEAWLAGALPQRDRWLRLMAQSDGLPEAVEASLTALREAHLAELRAAAGREAERQLRDLLRRRDGSAPGSGASGPAASPGGLWREAGELLLTAKGSWRQRFTRREGFAPGDRALRQSLDALVAGLQAVPGLREQLAHFLRLPAGAPGEAQQVLLRALTPVLKRLLAELRIAFAETLSADHTELALAAQQALGAIDAPSDLLLALDRRVEHILVDEFQDTSHLQWSLLERLTAGWEDGDGRTLFLVGDPMQSIYRFRDADLSLFIRARQRGLGEVRLKPIELGVNHRSAAELVDWVNTTFAAVFGARDPASASSPPFRAARAGRGPDADARVEIHLAGDNDDEIARVVAIARDEIEARPAQSIGILVRSRTHLIGLRAALARAGLKAHAIEIDSLIDTQTGRDLIALTQALVHEGDRLAWLGVLRGPWLGLGWQDLHALCAGERERTIRELLGDPACLDRLSRPGAERAAWLCDRIELGFSLRAGRSLGRWVRDCWRLIDGPAALESDAELDLAERFFAALDRLARDGDIDDPAALAAIFGRPAETEAPTETGLEIMTIHRAKGLEFDTIVLPGLSRTIRVSDYKLLLSNDIILSDGRRLSLLAAAAGDGPLRDYLKGLARDEDAAERARLLYVAATRARQRLHLVGSWRRSDGRPKQGSLLATLWPGIEREQRPDPGAAAQEATPADAAGGARPAFIELPLTRLRFDAAIPLPAIAEGAAAPADSARPEFAWVRPESVQVGTLIHRELQRLAERAAAAAMPVAPEIDTLRFARELALLGVDGADLRAAAGRVAEALEGVWSDPVGRWILKPWAEAWSELRLTIRGRGGLEHVRLDRSFVDDDGRRWIIDYKTGRHLGADAEGFLDAEVERYREQLERYARAVARTDARPIRVGLYFPLMSSLRDWAPPRAA